MFNQNEPDKLSCYKETDIWESVSVKREDKLKSLDSKQCTNKRIFLFIYILTDVNFSTG